MIGSGGEDRTPDLGILRGLSPSDSKAINELHPQIPNKSGKIRNPDAAKIRLQIAFLPRTTEKAVENEFTFTAYTLVRVSALPT
jgi:hypothetical protein